MKNIFYCILVSALLCSCSNNNKTGGKDANGKGDEVADNNLADDKGKITKRDYSITKQNAYSDLFLDSTSMEAFLIQTALPDSTTRRIRSFYNSRNYQFAWFTTKGLTEQARAFWNLHDYVTTYGSDTALRDKSLQRKMDAFIAEEELQPTAAGDFKNIELKLTQHFIQYIRSNFGKGYVKRKEMERFVPYKKQNPLDLADSLLNKKHKDDKYFADINEPYRLLQKQLQKYYELAKGGGWPTINTRVKLLKKGSIDPAVAALKKRLQATGQLAGNDTSQVFTDTLQYAVKLFQQSLGYTPTGELNAQLIKDLNVPATVRLTQLLINMDRMRWMPAEQASQLIEVNIPEFVLHVYENKNKVFDMNVVVGKEGHNTVSFNGDLSTIVFSPYWNIPSSIVRKEILPKMSASYLASQQMEVTGHEDGLPVIRQKPGEKNSLGKVKFLFPNSFNIYFHDTPAKSLFAQDKRAYSHGCIRLAEPEKMAQYLLKNDAAWPPDSIASAMNGGKERSVKLSKPVPVLISYYTAWVDEKGLLNFRDDIYQHDADLRSRMFL